jgi:hypothetical protein
MSLQSEQTPGRLSDPNSFFREIRAAMDYKESVTNTMRGGLTLSRPHNIQLINLNHQYVVTLNC